MLKLCQKTTAKFMFESWLFLVLPMPKSRKICDSIFCVHISCFFSMILALNSLLMCFVYMHHSSDAIFRHFPNFIISKICQTFVCLGLSSHSYLICWQASYLYLLITAHSNTVFFLNWIIIALQCGGSLPLYSKVNQL